GQCGAIGEVWRKLQLRVDVDKNLLCTFQAGNDARRTRDQNGCTVERVESESATGQVAVRAEIFFESQREESVERGRFNGGEVHVMSAFRRAGGPLPGS